MPNDPPTSDPDLHEGGEESGPTNPSPAPDGATPQSALQFSAPIGIPQFIGRYHIKRLIGHGGMGAVYEAIQEQPRRVVALKVLRTGAASRSALRRFAYESQLLARLRHAGIAQVFEAGTHLDNGVRVPFFAMEYVAGARYLTEFAEQKDLSTDERVDLFIKVCDAVNHGHQKGIVHRDLKPQNILVDSDGKPKVIDFGVARATDSDMAVTTQQTNVGSLVGTLQYMSPEQVAADPHDIDTRSDVYSLGVVLYELTCRKLPYDCSKSGVPEAVRMVREQQPARPTHVSAFVKRDLEVIILKAMEKDRDRRYRSAADLADDLRRYLTAQPVSARRASMAYQLKLFAKRNRTAVAAASVVFVALVAATTISSWMAYRARQDNAKLIQLTRFADAALGSRDESEQSREDANLSNKDASALAHETFANDPPAEARVRIAIARRYLDQKEFKSAADEAAIALALENVKPSGESTTHMSERAWAAAAIFGRASNSAKAGDGAGPRGTVGLLGPMLRNWRSIANQDLLPVLPVMDQCAAAYLMLDDLPGAGGMAGERAEAARRLYPDAPQNWIRPMHNLSLIEARLGRAPDARQHFEQARQYEEAIRLKGMDDSLGERDAFTAMLWPGNARVGIASAGVLATLDVEVPQGSEPAAYVYELAARRVREFLSGGRELSRKQLNKEPFAQTLKRELGDAWKAYRNQAAAMKQLPSAPKLRSFIDTSASWGDLSKEVHALDEVMEELERLPLRRCARWNAQSSLLNKFCPESDDGTGRLFGLDVLREAIGDPASASLSFRLAWRSLGNPHETEAAYDQAESLIARALRKDPARADYLTAKGIAQFRRKHFKDAATTLELARSMVRGNPANIAQCGEEIPTIFLAAANLSQPGTRMYGYTLLGQARFLVPADSGPLGDIPSLQSCELSEISTAQDFEWATYRLYLQEVESLATTAGTQIQDPQ